MSDGWPRVCSACGARHLFFEFPYRGRRVHSAPRDDIKLGCRRCYEPLMDWVDKDGDSYSLVLEDDPSVEGLREKARSWEEPKRDEVEQEPRTEEGPSVLDGAAGILRGVGVQLEDLARRAARALNVPEADAPPPSRGPVAPRERNERDPSRRRRRG